MGAAASNCGESVRDDEPTAEVADAGPCTVSGDVRELEFALLW